MTTSQKGSCAQPAREDHVPALKFFARRSAVAFPNNVGGDGAVELHAENSDGTEASLFVSILDWRRWVDLGWAVPEDAATDGRWRIANAGRLHLKRLLSRSGEPAELPRRDKTETSSFRLVGQLSQNDAESPLAWLRRRKDTSGNPFLSDAEYGAGERLRSDFWFAQMTPKVTANWSPVTSGRSRRCGGSGNKEADQREAVSDAGERVRAALSSVGPELSGVLIDVCCHLKGMESVEKASGWPQRSGKIVLRMALQAVARHYGLVGDHEKQDGRGSVQRDASTRIRQWGTNDYRPNAESW